MARSGCRSVCCQNPPSGSAGKAVRPPRHVSTIRTGARRPHIRDGLRRPVVAADVSEQRRRADVDGEVGCRPVEAVVQADRDRRAGCGVDLVRHVPDLSRVSRVPASRRRMHSSSTSRGTPLRMPPSLAEKRQHGPQHLQLPVLQLRYGARLVEAVQAGDVRLDRHSGENRRGLVLAAADGLVRRVLQVQQAAQCGAGAVGLHYRPRVSSPLPGHGRQGGPCGGWADPDREGREHQDPRAARPSATVGTGHLERGLSSPKGTGQASGPPSGFPRVQFPISSPSSSSSATERQGPRPPGQPHRQPTQFCAER
jgi:hypothetical protein